MIFYFLFFIMIAALTLFSISWSHPLSYILFFSLVLFVGFRYEVGGDWNSYLTYFHNTGIKSFFDLLKEKNFAYSFLSWISIQGNLPIMIVNLLCALIALGGLWFFVTTFSLGYLGLLMSYPYFIVVVSMGYTRQSVSIGLMMAGISFLKKQKNILATLCFFMMPLFHLASFIPLMALSVWLLYQFRCYKTLFILGCGSLTGLFLFSESLLPLINHYNPFSSSGFVYQSLGSIPRATFTAFFALLFITQFSSIKNLFQNRLSSSLFYGLSLLSLLNFFSSFIFSTFSDRTGLFFLPLVILVPSYLAHLWLHQRKKILTASVFLNFLYLTFWFYFSSYAQNSWLPYRLWIPWL
jgi:hypothetical protein